MECRLVSRQIPQWDFARNSCFDKEENEVDPVHQLLPAVANGTASERDPLMVPGLKVAIPRSPERRQLSVHIYPIDEWMFRLAAELRLHETLKIYSSVARRCTEGG